MKKLLTVFFLLLAFFFSLTDSASAQRKTKTQPKRQKELFVNYQNIDSLMKKAEDLYAKGEIQESLSIFEKINEHSKNVLEFLSSVEQKSKDIQSLPQDPKKIEASILRSRRIANLKESYTGYLAKSSYYLGSIHYRLSNIEAANKYLLEALKNSDSSDDPNSTYRRSFDLLRKIYGLEGEIQ